MTAPVPGPAGAYLAKVAASDTAGIKGHPWIDDVPRLVAALEAVLALTEPRDKIDRDLDGNPEQPLIRLVRCDEVREAVEAALRDAQGRAG